MPQLAARPGEVVTRARQSLEQALEEITPAMRAVLDRMVAMSPDEAMVEFGLALGAEAGIVVAKGTSEMHFAVTLHWKRPRPGAVADE
ncbi:MAG TPA: CU044_2847 family protein [Pseudonocardiaceae bacterium]|nr:CU044_2847 family protein [Pseudonocardiaceae bacterium]